MRPLEIASEIVAGARKKPELEFFATGADALVSVSRLAGRAFLLTPRADAAALDHVQLEVGRRLLLHASAALAISRACYARARHVRRHAKPADNYHRFARRENPSYRRRPSDPPRTSSMSAFASETSARCANIRAMFSARSHQTSPDAATR